MTTTTKLFHRDGQLYATLIETSDGRIVSQEWRYAKDAAPFAGAQTGCTEINVRLLHDENVTQADVEALIDAWTAAIAKPGFRDSGRGGEEGARAFLARTKGRGVLTATTRA